MKTKKIISFLLMLTILFTMNIAPVLAEDTETRTLTTSAGVGGSITPSGITSFEKDDLACGEDEHNHEDGGCDLSILDCDKLHTHDDGCYAVCPLEQHLEHDDSCYENRRTCGKEEHDCEFLECSRITCGEETHVHTLDCIGLVCTKEVHVHKLSCYNWKLELKCGKKAHIHDDVFDDCYDKVCGKHTHVHVPSCHTFSDCGKSHKHSDPCYENVEICSGLHEHNDDCQSLTCGKTEHSEEDHSVENGCYKCSLTEHSHGDGCNDWPEADVEATPNPGYYIKSITIDDVSITVLNPNTYSDSLKMNKDHKVEVVFDEKPERELTVSFDQNASDPGVTNAWVIANPSTEDIVYSWTLFGDGSRSGGGTIAADATIPIETDVENNPDEIRISWTDSFGVTQYRYEYATPFAGITAETSNGRFEDEDGRTLSSTPTYYFAGTTVILKAIPNSGYHFVNGSWIIVPEDVVESINGDTATLEIPDYEPQRAAYKGAIITLAAIEDSLPGDDDYNDNELDAPRITVEGQFKKNSTPSRRESDDTMYTLDVDVDGPGNVSPMSGSYESGSNVKLTPTADEGAQFVGWFGKDGDDVSDSNRILMNGSKSVIARFEAIPAEEEDEFIDEDIPEAGDIVEEEIIPDEYVPEAGETLPQTGGIPMELLVGIGFALIGGGVSLGKKEEKKEKK